MEILRPNFKVHNCIFSLLLDKYAIMSTDSYIIVMDIALTDVPILLAWSTQHVLHMLFQPTLTYSTGPWSKENRMMTVESFFQANAYHPFA